MIEEKISRALQSAGKLAIAQCSSPTLPFQALGRTLVKPSDQKWFEFVQIRNNPASGTWGNEQDYQGFFRIILHWPINNEGDYAVTAIIDSLAEYFKKETRSYQDNIAVTFYDNPTLTSVIETSGERLFPLSMRYRCFKP